MAIPKTDIDLDGVLAQIGQFGKFQLKQFGLMVIPIIFQAFFLLNYIFTAGSMNYRCEVPECDNSPSASYYTEWLNKTVPIRDGLPVKCERFIPISNATSTDSFYCDASGFDRSALIECGSFIFEDEVVTIVQDFNITCPHNDWKLTLVGTIHNVGQLVALPIAGYFSDRYGRRLVLLLSIVGSSLVGLVRSFSTSYPMFLALEFLDPAIGSTMYTTAFILAMELVGPKMRVTGNCIISCAFATGEAVLGMIAMFFRNWRTLLRILYIPGLMMLPLVWMTSESVRWLISKGHRERAFKVLQEAARLNRKTLSLEVIETHCTTNVASEESQDTEEKSFFVLLKHAFKNAGLLLRIVNCSFCWMTNGLVYYGLSLNSVSLAGDRYVNFILVSLAELPGIIVMQLLLDRIGRKKTLCSTMLICGLFCFLSEFMTLEQYWPNLVMFLISKMAITVSFDTLYIYTAEIFPTNLRQSLLSYCSMFARAGAMVAPQTPLLAKLWGPLPMVVFGSFGIASGLAILQFPETLNTQLPDTVEEAMNIRRDGKENKVEK